MGKTLIFSDVDYSGNAIPNTDILDTISYDNATLKAMVSEDAIGKYVATNGKVTSGDSTNSYVVVGIQYYKRIVISGYTGTAAGAFLSSASPSQSTFISAVTRSSAGSFDNRSIDIPEGATHFAFNMRTNYSNYALTKYAE
jgi:hypothetical protein